METAEKRSTDPRPIGVCDSGLGGLTAVRRLREVLPEEDVVFLGDTGRLPYGGRSSETILRYAKEDLAFLLGQDVKAVVVACGTLSSIALPRLEGLPVPVFGVVEGAALRAAALTRNGRVGVLGTDAAIRSGAYVRSLRVLRPEVRTLAVACPRFVPLIEAGLADRGDARLRDAVEEYLGPVRDFGADALILGCTHYPLISGAIRDFLGGQTALVDVAAAAVDALKRQLAKSGALCPRSGRGSLRCHVTGSPERFAALAERFLPMEGRLSIRRIKLEEQERDR
jgi:glutamate racemase